MKNARPSIYFSVRRHLCVEEPVSYCLPRSCCSRLSRPARMPRHPIPEGHGIHKRHHAAFPHWAFMVMPGHRFEFFRGADPRTTRKKPSCGNFSPVPSTFRNLRVHFKLPLWYYYMAFPIDADDRKTAGGYDDRFWSHISKWCRFSNLTWSIKDHQPDDFSQQVYADNRFYNTENQKKGYSLLIRQMLCLRVRAYADVLAPAWR